MYPQKFVFDEPQASEDIDEDPTLTHSASLDTNKESLFSHLPNLSPGLEKLYSLNESSISGSHVDKCAPIRDDN